MCSAFWVISYDIPCVLTQQMIRNIPFEETHKINRTSFNPEIETASETSRYQWQISDGSPTAKNNVQI